MSTFHTYPLKLYIQDIFRAKRTEGNKYVYELFGLTFKNIMIHGVVTAVYNTLGSATNLELTDSTGSVQIYYDSMKNNYNIPDSAMKTLMHEFQCMSHNNNENMAIMKMLKKNLVSKTEKRINFVEGDYMSVIGDIFLDNLREMRMVSAYECNITSIKREIVWLEELQYLYEKFYLWQKQETL